MKLGALKNSNLVGVVTCVPNYKYPSTSFELGYL